MAAADRASDVSAAAEPIKAPSIESRPPEPVGPTRASLRVEAVLSADGDRMMGMLPMRFELFDAQTSTKPIWSESQDQVVVTGGRFEVLLGVGHARLPSLPTKVWVAIEVDGELLEPRSELAHYRSIVQG